MRNCVASVGTVVALVLCTLTSTASQTEGMPKKEKILHNKADLKLIACSACEEVSKVVHRTVTDMRKELAEGKKLKEIDIIEKLEKMCDPEETDGAWVSNYDITEKKGKLVLEDHGINGRCKVECQTIAKACDNLLGEHDTDIAEELYKESVKRAQLTQMLCYDLTDSCSRKPPKLPKGGRPHDEEWEEIPEEELKVQRMMREMKGAGMPGMSMYNRDELMDQFAGMGDEDGYGYDDYGDDYGTEEPPLGDPVMQVQTPGEILQDVVQTAADTVESAVEGAKNLASKVTSMFSAGSSDSASQAEL